MSLLNNHIHIFEIIFGGKKYVEQDVKIVGNK